MPTLRVGVTGHRSLADVPGVTAAVDAVVARVGTPAGAATAGERPRALDLVVVSSLAEGADRLVVQRVLAHPGAVLEVVLPLPADDYAHDFATAASRAEFDTLVARARSVEVVAPAAPVREEAYERAGRAVVDRSDVVIALWDGEPARGRGGTAEVVRYATDRGITVEIVLVEREGVR